ncbi:MAG: glycosyltransferase family 1 protein [Cyanobacteria bacterium J06634_6]
MRIAILRRARHASFSMDVYADALIAGLHQVRPHWEIVELFPQDPTQGSRTNSLVKGLQKYYQRYRLYPRQLRAHIADVYHIIDHSDGYLVAHLKQHQAPTVVTCHDIINLIHPELFLDRARFPKLSMATWQHSLRRMCEADQVITVSRHTAKDIVAHLPLNPAKVTVIPNGVESSFNPLDPAETALFRESLGIPPEVCCLLNVGSNNPRKNIITILKALDRLGQAGLLVHFCKAGDDFTGAQKAFIRDHNLADHVTYLGKPDKNTLQKIYNAADILVAPSTYEGFGITVLEAMMCGLPTITSNVTSLPEVAGDAAILIDPLNTTALCEAIERLNSDPQLKQSLIHKGRARAQTFTWENTAEQVAQTYERLTQNKLNRSISKSAVDERVNAL